jgi:chitinase
MKVKIILLIAVLLFSGLYPAVRAEKPPDTNRELTVYFPSWAIYSPTRQNQQVRDLPWGRLSTVNHAFWRIAPNEDYTEFPIASFDPWADFDMPDNHFSQYAEMNALYPDVKILLSIGGWTHPVRSWSLMVATEEGRRSFIESCMYWFNRYPWIGGIDLDWEYPGTSRSHEGADFVGSHADRNNFTLLLQEMRMTFDTSGFACKLITVCIPTGTPVVSNGQRGFNHPAIAPYVHRINVMTYDMVWSGTTHATHQTALFPGSYAARGLSAAETVGFLLEAGVPPHRINIGTPLYSHGWVLEADAPADALGSRAVGAAAGTQGAGQLYGFNLAQLENAPGWYKGFDPVSAAAFLFNYDADSPYFQTFYTYESKQSLQAKLDFINENGLGGIIVWNTAGDCMESGFPMLTMMWEGLAAKPETPPPSAENGGLIILIAAGVFMSIVAVVLQLRRKK